MLIFIDTEFTDFLNIDLISVALVSEDGREFYAERNDYRQEDCNDFVHATVLPLLGRIDGARCSYPILNDRLRTWFEALPEPATLVFDYFSDWELLIDALLGDFHEKVPTNVGGKLMLGHEVEGSQTFITAYEAAFTPAWPPHHALADARALRAGYLTWLEQEVR